MRRSVQSFALLAALVWIAVPAFAAVTYQVNSSGDGADADPNDGICETSTPGQCTLRAALQQTDVTGGTIHVPAIAITLTGAIDIHHDVSIVGAGMHATVVSGNGLYPMFRISSVTNVGHVVSISDMTLRDGHADSGAAIDQYLGQLTVDRCFFTNNYANYGGAVFVERTTTATIRDSVFTDNHALSGGFAGAVVVYNADLTLIDVSLTGNSAPNGGALQLLGSTATLTNVTLGANSADTNGGAVYLASTIDRASGLYLYSSTMTANRAYDGAGGGLYLADSNQYVLLQNSILAFNVVGCALCFTTYSNCHGAITSGGNAVITPACAASGAFISTDPKLGPLQDNGGANGPTYALKAGSSAIDSGTVGGCPLTDQRGVHRETGVACDMGAYEHSPCGDANGDGSLNVSDAFLLINYLFASGPTPPGLTNVNGDGVTNIADVFYLINLLFAGGAAGQCPGT